MAALDFGWAVETPEQGKPTAMEYLDLSSHRKKLNLKTFFSQEIYIFILVIVLDVLTHQKYIINVLYSLIKCFIINWSKK
jgi:hypothetical protein